MSSNLHSRSRSSTNQDGVDQQAPSSLDFPSVQLRPVPYSSDLDFAYSGSIQTQKKQGRPHSIQIDSTTSGSSSPASSMIPFTPNSPSKAFDTNDPSSQFPSNPNQTRKTSEWTLGTYSTSSDLTPQLQVYETAHDQKLHSSNIYSCSEAINPNFFGTPLSAGRSALNLFSQSSSSSLDDQDHAMLDVWDGREISKQQQHSFYHHGKSNQNQNFQVSAQDQSPWQQGFESLEIDGIEEKGTERRGSRDGRPNSAGRLQAPIKENSDLSLSISEGSQLNFFYGSPPEVQASGSRSSTSRDDQLSSQKRRLRSATLSTIAPAPAPSRRTSSGLLLSENKRNSSFMEGSNPTSEFGGRSIFGRRSAIDASTSLPLINTSTGNFSTMSSPLTLSSSQEYPSSSSGSPSGLVGNLNLESPDYRSPSRNSTKSDITNRSSFKPDRREKDRIGSKSRRDGEKDAMSTLRNLLLGDQPLTTAKSNEGSSNSSKSSRVTRAQILELAIQTMQDREEEVQSLEKLIRRERAQRVEEKLEWKSELEKALRENQKLRAEVEGSNGGKDGRRY